MMYIDFCMLYVAFLFADDDGYTVQKLCTLLVFGIRLVQFK